MVWVSFLFLLPPAIAMAALIGSNIESSSVNYEPTWEVTVGNTWSAQQLGQIALGETMTAVVSGIGGVDLGEPGVWIPSVERVEELVGQVSVAELRGIILAGASKVNGGPQNMLSNFANTDDAAATCAMADTAGWGGIDACTSQCGSQRSAVLRKAPNEGSCRLLCTLAVEPCEKIIEMNSSWASRMMKNWSNNLATMSATVGRVTATTSTEGRMAGGGRRTMSRLPNDEVLSSVCLALSLVLLMAVFISCSFSDLSKLMTEVRRVEQHTVSTQGQAAAVRQKRGFQPRRARTSPEGLYYDDGVAPEICRAIAEAKRDFSRKGKACSLLVEGLLSRKMEASVTKRFGRWKRNAAAAKGVVKEAVDDAGGDEEKSKGEKAGDGW